MNASMTPGVTVARKRSLIGVPVIRPYMMSTIDGGIIVPSDPPATTIPMLIFLS